MRATLRSDGIWRGTTISIRLFSRLFSCDIELFFCAPSVSLIFPFHRRSKRVSTIPSRTRLLSLYEQFADALLHASKLALPLFRSSEDKNLFFVRLNVNTVRPGFDSTSRTLPPCSSAIRRARVSPRPVPLGFPAVTNGSNKVLRTEAGIPGPLSEIVTQISSSTSVR
jgi:hypothetical protein